MKLQTYVKMIWNQEKKKRFFPPDLDASLQSHEMQNLALDYGDVFSLC